LGEISAASTISELNTVSLSKEDVDFESSSSLVHSMEINQLESMDEQKHWSDSNELGGNVADCTLVAQQFPNHDESDKVEKWRKHCKHGKFIENTKIIPTKVFLMESKWQSYLNNEEKYSIHDLLEYTNSLQMKIGVIIDLNRSYDYYDFAKFQAEDSKLAQIKYLKLKMDTDVPCPEFIDNVFQELTLAHLSGEGVIIHCFNGLNRTGFIIIDFLCRFFGLSLDEALDQFETARGHRIENEVLRQVLVQRFRPNDTL